VVRELTRVAIWETEEEWLARAMDRPLREVEQMVSGRERGDLPDAPSRPENVRHVLRHEVSAETFALFRQARNALQDEMGEALDDDGFLALLAERALESGDGQSPRRQVALNVCVECKRGWQDGAGVVVELDENTLQRIECDADRVDSEGRITRHIPEPTRRMVLRRDHNRCRVPGCRSSRNLDVHHVVEFAHGGSHEAANLVTICSGHHRAIHEGRLTLTMENGEPKFERFAPRPAANDASSVTETAQRALIGLGFKKSEAQSFVESAIAHVGKTATVQELVHEALKRSPIPQSKSRT